MPKANWEGYVNIRLEKADKEEIKRRADKIKPAELWAFVEDCVMHGYAVSIGPDVDNASLIATMTGKDSITLNAGLSMSQRHDNPVVCMTALMYAHNEKAGGGSWEDGAEDWRKTDW